MRHMHRMHGGLTQICGRSRRSLGRRRYLLCRLGKSSLECAIPNFFSLFLLSRRYLGASTSLYDLTRVQQLSCTLTSTVSASATSDDAPLSWTTFEAPFTGD